MWYAIVRQVWTGNVYKELQERASAARDTEEQRPLSGVRVLDLSRVLAGPMCARTFAEHGADVLKVASSSLPDMRFGMVDVIQVVGGEDNLQDKFAQQRASVAQLQR